jgi:hypothetical protein
MCQHLDRCQTRRSQGSDSMWHVGQGAKSGWQLPWPSKTRVHRALYPSLPSTSVLLLGSGTCARETWAALGSRCARLFAPLGVSSS